VAEMFPKFETFTPERLKQEYAEHPEKFGAAFHFVFDTFFS
jgi:hypothetical protein